LGDEEQTAHYNQPDPQLGLRKVQKTVELQRRALITRDQMKSDQPCLMIPECTIVIEENNEAESERFESAQKGGVN
jgi:hypothetical protein